MKLLQVPVFEGSVQITVSTIAHDGEIYSIQEKFPFTETEDPEGFLYKITRDIRYYMNEKGTIN